MNELAQKNKFIARLDEINKNARSKKYSNKVNYIVLVTGELRRLLSETLDEGHKYYDVESIEKMTTEQLRFLYKVLCNVKSK